MHSVSVSSGDVPVRSSWIRVLGHVRRGKRLGGKPDFARGYGPHKGRNIPYSGPLTWTTRLRIAKLASQFLQTRQIVG